MRGYFSKMILRYEKTMKAPNSSQCCSTISCPITLGPGVERGGGKDFVKETGKSPDLRFIFRYSVARIPARNIPTNSMDNHD